MTSVNNEECGECGGALCVRICAYECVSVFVRVPVCICKMHVCVCARTPRSRPQCPHGSPTHTQALTPLCCPFQTILVGDSGVGKTSLLVQFDQGKFIPGSFSATVGIGFTVSAPSLRALGGLCQGPGRKQAHIGSFKGGLIRRLSTMVLAGCWKAGRDGAALGGG